MNNEIEKFTGQDAKDLDAAIRSLARTVHIALDALVLLVGQAQENQIHLALGFPTWSAYLADALDGQWKIERDRRGEAIKFLTDQGVSQRQITKITGASKGTIHRELHGAPLGHVLDVVAGTEPVIDGETDSEFRARLRAEREASKNADGRVTFTIPATIEEARTAFEKLAIERRRITRIAFDMMFAWVEDQPASSTKDAWEFGLMMRDRRARLLWLLEDGLDFDQISEVAGISVAMIEDILAAPQGDDADYFSSIFATAREQSEEE